MGGIKIVGLPKISNIWDRAATVPGESVEVLSFEIRWWEVDFHSELTDGQTNIVLL